MVIRSSRLLSNIDANQVREKRSSEVVFNKILNMKTYL